MRAFLSVSDKEGLIEFAQDLLSQNVSLVSTGGTAAALKKAGLPVMLVSDITGFPECLDGRVKTLHPNVHAGILARRENLDHMKQLDMLNITPIDIVVVNLYPFKETIEKLNVTLEDAIENIDIGGPTMLRAAAKNWQDVVVVVDPKDYSRVAEEMKQGGVAKSSRFEFACKVFAHTAEYDKMIAKYLSSQKQ